MLGWRMRTRSVAPSLRMTAAAYPDRTFLGKIIYVGSEVDPVTRRVRLLAELPNPDGTLHHLDLYTARIAIP